MDVRLGQIAVSHVPKPRNVHLRFNASPFLGRGPFVCPTSANCAFPKAKPVRSPMSKTKITSVGLSDAFEWVESWGVCGGV